MCVLPVWVQREQLVTHRSETGRGETCCERAVKRCLDLLLLSVLAAGFTARAQRKTGHRPAAC